jgi:16S rRNA (guanine527-N7)-methyltransferase
MVKDLEDKIREAANAVDVELNTAQAAALAQHLSMVLRTNAEMNLTSVTDPDGALWVHVADSLSVVPDILSSGAESVADIGSGAGYPGVPIAVATGLPVALIESTGKKARFLESVFEELALEGEVVVARAEEVALTRAKAFDAVTARAVASLPSLVELAAPLLAEGGRLYAMKGAPDAEEISRGQRVAAQVGMTMRDRRRFQLPGVDQAREIVVYERIGPSRVAIPRRAGMAQRHPLA